MLHRSVKLKVRMIEIQYLDGAFCKKDTANLQVKKVLSPSIGSDRIVDYGRYYLSTERFEKFDGLARLANRIKENCPINLDDGTRVAASAILNYKIVAEEVMVVQCRTVDEVIKKGFFGTKTKEVKVIFEDLKTGKIEERKTEEGVWYEYGDHEAK